MGWVQVSVPVWNKMLDWPLEKYNPAHKKRDELLSETRKKTDDVIFPASVDSFPLFTSTYIIH
jgi:hypothetical protein